MKRPSKQGNLLKRILSETHSLHNSRYNLSHKKTWLALVNHETWPFTPNEIHEKLQKYSKFPEYLPRGDKLLSLRTRQNFTILPSGKPGRPEEALERLIVQNNKEQMYGQMPIGGGKESVDIVKLENQNSMFIELKPWRSTNSPLYALLEGLKNLMLYRILEADGHPGCQIIAHVNLAVLAPIDYFQAHRLVNADMKIINRLIVQSFLDAIAQEFQTRVTFLALDWPEEALWEVCASLSPEHSGENQMVTVQGYPDIDNLREKNWIELIAVE